MALGADVMDADGALAIGLLALGAAVLALDADGMLALLGEGAVVDDEVPGGVGEGLGHDGAVAAPDGLLVSGTLAEELLEGLIGVGDVESHGQRDAIGDGFDALAVAVPDESPSQFSREFKRHFGVTPVEEAEQTRSRLVAG
jgi:hypothetical protein